MTAIELWGARGGGSAVIEAALAMAGFDFVLREGAFWGDPASHEALIALNRTGQIPAMTTPDGAFLTESAAMLLWIAEAAPEKGLAPKPGAPERARFLRWLMYLASFYGTYAISDRPERWVEGDDTVRAAVKAGALERRKWLWRVAEETAKPDPFLAGAELTLADVYMAMMSRWSPGRAWFDAQCPVLRGAVERAEAHPVVAEVWARNFDL